MRRLAFGFVVVALAGLTVYAQTKVLALRGTGGGGGFCGGSFQYCDDFSGSLSNWTQENGTWSISAGVLVGPASGSNAATLKWTADTGGLTQYACVEFDTYAGQQGVLLRHESAVRSYGVVVSNADNILYWSSYNASEAWIFDHASCSLTFAAGNWLCAKVTGTGTSTVVEAWKLTSAPTAAPSGTADCTFTQDPEAGVTDANAGLKVGIIYEGFDSGKTFDHWAGGGS